MFNNMLPSLDLHGETRDVSRVLVNDFIRDNYKLGHSKVVIIHGIGTGILKKEVHKVLRNNKLVLRFFLDNFNPGTTVVELCNYIDK